MFCPCTNSVGTMPWNNFSVDPPAPWMLALRNQEWFLTNAHLLPNPMYSIPGVTAMSVCIDWMHTKYLGTDQYFLGSVLWCMCNFLFDGSLEAVCAEIWGDVKEEYRTRRTPTRYRVLKVNMFSSGSGGYPQLKGKAHAIKHLGLIIRDLFENLTPPREYVPFPQSHTRCTQFLGKIRRDFG